MEQPLGPQPCRAPREGKDEAQQQAGIQSLDGHGQVLLVSEFWEEKEGCVGPQKFAEQAPVEQPSPAGSSSTRATDGHSSPSSCDSRGPKRSGDSSASRADCPAAKSRCQARPKRGSHTPRRAKRKAAPQRQAAAAPGPSQGPRAAKSPAPRCPDAPQPPAQLLLVLCRESALHTQLPRLQLLLQQVRARHRRPPAALVGVIVQPRPHADAEARRRMETLLCSVFAPRSPAVEVHTAVFCPGRPGGTLNFQRASCLNPEAAAPGCGRLVDRETQTDGEGPEGWGAPAWETPK